MEFKEPSPNKQNETSESREEVPAEVVLNEERYGEGFPEGEPGEVRKGYTFVGKVEKENEVGWEHITADMVDEPVLTAVTEEQKERWSNREIRAIPVEFQWNEDREIWQVVAE